MIKKYFSKKSLFTAGILLGAGLLISCGVSKSKTAVQQGMAINGSLINYTTEQLTKATRSASQILLKRLPTQDELNQVTEGGLLAYDKVIRKYVSDPEFKNTMVKYHEDYFQMGGKRPAGDPDTTDYSEPANLATYIIINDRDYREIITANYCVVGSSLATDFSKCSSSLFNPINPNQADYRSMAGDDLNSPGGVAAGVLTTRAFLRKWAAPYNFRRVKNAFSAFACSEYPDESDDGMPVTEISGQSDGKGSTADFNSLTQSPVCYSCHKNMNPRAALYYNFKKDGFFDGLTIDKHYAPGNGNTPGDVQDNENNMTTYIYKILNSGTAAAPVVKDPVYKGKTVKTLREFAFLLAQSEKFRKCIPQRFYNYFVGKKNTDPLPDDLNYLVDMVAKEQYKVRPIIVEILKSPAFVLR